MGYIRSASMIFLMLCIALSKINAQTYSNGPLSTGATSSNGVAAPAGTTWSEVQNPNVNAGFAANIPLGFTVADNFTVCGSWNVTKVTFYAYSTGFTGTTSPFTDVRVQIYNTDPSVGNPAPVFGNLTTNRFLSSSFANMYRIFNATTGTTRRIWTIEATVNTTLATGNYWIEWQLGNGGISNFSPAVTVTGASTQPGWNAKRRTLPSTWANITDAGGPQDMPFLIDYTTAACTGTPTPGNTIASAASVCPGTPVNLSLQSCSPGTGITYQWQSAAAVGGPYTNIPGATNASLSTTIMANTFFQALVTCSGNTGTSTPVLVALTPPSSCYCAASATELTDEKISRVILNTINNPSTSTAGYENFTSISTSLEPGRPYPLSVTVVNPFASDQVIVWIDFNQNGSFTDAGERVYISPAGFPTVAPATVTSNVIVPFSALPGTTRMRVRLHDTSFGPNATSCGSSDFGQVEDYNVVILPVVPCTGTPNPGNTISSASTVCSGTNFTLSLQNFTSGSGITYQWQSSPTGAAGTFTNIAGATSVFLTTSLTDSTSYQAVVSCGANTATSTPVRVLLSSFINCYCTPPPSNCNLDDRIANVTFGSSLNNSSTCSTNGYANYKSTVAATDIVSGAANPMRVTVGPGGTEFVGVWIDYNHNAVFEASEFTLLGSGNGVTIANNIMIPSTALLGQTAMRVRVRFGTTLTGANACLGYGFGETEDYLVNIVPCVPVTVTTQPTAATITCGANATFSVVTSGSLPVYQWQTRTTSTGIWQNVTNTGIYAGATTTSLTLTNVPTTFSGYQYRVLITGACSASDPSNAVALTVNPLITTVTPTSANICLGSIQQLSITNTVATSQTATFNATGLPVAIPDGTFPVTTSTAIPIAVSGIPAGSVIQNVGIRFSITHPYVGDLVMNLKAPNDQKLNMFALLNGGAGNNSTANFSNTTIDSVSTANISGAPAPRSGSYRAEKFAITNPNFGDLVVTNTSWSSLLGTINGTWNINVADLGAGDVGTVTAMSLFVTYTAPDFAQGTWTTTRPGTIYTDAAATTVYTGTPATTVYVKPDTSGVINYSVSFATSTCQSTVVTIPVTVRSLPTSISAVTNKTICANGNTSFTATPDGGFGFTYQWQVSADGGSSYTNLTNGGVYGGATTNTLTITGAGVALNNNRYRLSALAAPCAGSSNSAAATLTVNPTPVIVISANPLTAIYPGQITKLTAAVSPNPAATYTWFRDGIAVAGAAASSLDIDVDKLGLYTVRVIDDKGCTALSNAVRISAAGNDILFIYPSPNTGQFQVRYFSELGSTQFPRTVNVFDSKGTRIFTKAYNINSPYTRIDVDLRNHTKGIYTVELTDFNGNRIKTGRVLVL